jgi:hypothetical protein
MAKFVLAYRTPNALAHSRAEAGTYTADPETLAAWEAWFAGIGDRVVEPGSPVFARGTVGETGADTALGGYSVVEADDLAAAIAFAEGCPVLQYGGGVEVGELTTVNAT